MKESLWLRYNAVLNCVCHNFLLLFTDLYWPSLTDVYSLNKTGLNIFDSVSPSEKSFPFCSKGGFTAGLLETPSFVTFMKFFTIDLDRLDSVASTSEDQHLVLCNVDSIGKFSSRQAKSDWESMLLSCHCLSSQESTSCTQHQFNLTHHNWNEILGDSRKMRRCRWVEFPYDMNLFCGFRCS